MLDFLEKDKCSGCYACAEKCPQKCITMIPDKEGFWYPQIALDQCISCGLCRKVCPINNMMKSDRESGRICYAAINNNEQIKEKSSSGGIFYSLATLVLERKGVVFGAAFDEEFNVVHKAAQTFDELQMLCGSKYVQSRIGSAYKECELFLKEGRLVLFTGTPCQIGGLLAFLGKDYENLYTQDIICHGVPSPKVWNKYINYRESKAGSKMKTAAFRNKRVGWKMFSVKMMFANSKAYMRVFIKDLYMQGFLANLFLRPSCHNCSFKNDRHISDITLADFWGIEKIDPSMFNNKGTSLVIINTQKGKNLFSGVKDVAIKEEDINLALKYNPNYYKSSAMNANREAFFGEVETTDFKQLMNRYAKIPFLKRCKQFLTCVIKYRTIR